MAVLFAFIIFIIIIGFSMSLLLDKQNLLKAFKDGNCIVYGRKGKGKDLLFQYVINKRKKYCYTNMDYGKLTTVVEPKLFQCPNNDFGSLIENRIKKFRLPFKKKADAYFSDGGVIFPSQYNHILNKNYMGMPIFAALSRQLAQMNMHFNTQALQRVWKSLREQTDSFIWVQSRKIGLFFIRINWVIYCREADALAERLPMKERRGLFRRKDEQIEIYNHQIGAPVLGRSYIAKRKIYYDTYYFAKVFLIPDTVEIAPNLKKKLTSK